MASESSTPSAGTPGNDKQNKGLRHFSMKVRATAAAARTREAKRHTIAALARRGTSLTPSPPQVCKKVEEKGQTTYNEVADELVAEFLSVGNQHTKPGEKPAFDEKNIRRRVYGEAPRGATCPCAQPRAPPVPRPHESTTHVTSPPTPDALNVLMAMMQVALLMHML